MSTRRCTKCGGEFPATAEYFLKSQAGRLRGECKRCSAKCHAAYYQKNRALLNAKNREWARDNRERRRQHVKTYSDANREKCREAVARWYAKDPEHARAVSRAKTKRWYQRHLEHGREVRRNSVKKRKALKRGASINTLTRQQWDAIKAHYGHRCVYCDRRKKLTQDHLVPLSRGGQHTAQNVVPACMSCNCRKKAGPPLRPVQPLLLT